MKRVCAGIVTYNPDMKRLKENISAIIEQVACVVIVDNSSDTIQQISDMVSEYENIVLIKFNTNKGIASALNKLCEWAFINKYEWMLTLDQDSVCSSNMIEKMLKYVSSDSVAIVAPRIVYRNNEDVDVISENEIDEVKWVITSASLTNIKIWKKINGFDEKLFIDMVDYDYCIRANRQSYKVIRVNNIVLLHELGNLKCKKMLGRTIYVTNHSYNRVYYMVRNIIYLWKKLRDENPFKYILKLCIKIIIYEDKKLKKVHYIFKGICDGLKLKQETN